MSINDDNKMKQTAIADGTENSKSWGRVLGLAVAFWTIVLGGPFVLWLWNELSRYKYREGELGYLFFITVSQAVSCAIALVVANKISAYKHKMAVVVNAAICGTVLAILTFIQWHMVATEERISNILSMLVLIIGAVVVTMSGE